MGYRRAQRPHAKGNDIHSAPAHAAVKKRLQFFLHFSWNHPVIGGARVRLIGGAYEGATFHSGHIFRVRTAEKTVGAFFFIEANKRSAFNHLVTELVVFLLGTVTHINLIRFGQIEYCFNPAQKDLIVGLGTFDLHIRHGDPPV